MENMKTPIRNLNESQDLVLNKESLGYLTIIRKWAMFFAILGFIGIGFMAIAALFIGIASTFGAAFGGMHESWILVVITFVYIILAGLYLMAVLYLLRFSTKMKSAIETSDQINLVVALKNLKSHFKYVGIMTIAIMGLYILMIFVFLIVGATSIF